MSLKFVSTTEPRKIIVLGNQFPSDDDLKKEMEEFLLSFRDMEYAGEWQVAKRFKLPESFRESMFNKSFFTCGFDDQSDHKCELSCFVGGGGHHHYCNFICGPHFPRLDDGEEEEDDRFSGKETSHFFFKDKFLCKGKICNEKGKPEFVLADSIVGYFDYYWKNQIYFCRSCADDFMLNNVRKMCEDYLPCKDLAGIIHNYLRSPFTLSPITGTNDEGGPKYKRIVTGHFLDWFKFMEHPEDETISWYINCNLDSPFYGYVLMDKIGNEMFMEGTIDEFAKKFNEFISFV